MQHDFGLHDLMYLLRGGMWTVALSLIAFAGGGALGLFVALCRIAKGHVVHGLATAFVRANQGTPLLIQIFIVFFGATMAGWDISALTAAALCLSINAAAFLGEVLAGCITAVPEGQWQAAEALGLRPTAKYARVILPQAARIAVAPTVGFLVHVIKGTSLASLIGFVELSRAGQIINNNTFQPLLVFGIIGALYFVICWPLSFASRRLEQRLGAARGA
jgi:polar amino acid transport system permease protein